jgi:hypothetical protein
MKLNIFSFNFKRAVYGELQQQKFTIVVRIMYTVNYIK